MTKGQGVLAGIILISVMLLLGCSPTEREGLETIVTGTYDSSMTTGRSQVRDAVRDGALLANGGPLFTQIDTDYGFDGDVFRINGQYLDASGQTRQGSLAFELSAEDGALRATIVDYDLAGLEVDVTALEEGIAQRLADDVASVFSEPIVAFLDVSPEASNMVVISFRLAADLDNNVIPMDVP